MKIILGLGNPGNQYQDTRHNLGFMVLDALAQRLDLTFRAHKKTKSLLAKNDHLILLKPQTFVGKSGEAAVAALNFFNLSAEDLVVVHDDLDLEFGQFKQVFASGPKEHNGLLSIEEQLGTDQFHRVRIGVDGRAGDRSLAGRDYLLQPFSEREVDSLKEIITQLSVDLST